jgi:hypothetical protein
MFSMTGAPWRCVQDIHARKTFLLPSNVMIDIEGPCSGKSGRIHPHSSLRLIAIAPAILTASAQGLGGVIGPPVCEIRDWHIDVILE